MVPAAFFFFDRRPISDPQAAILLQAAFGGVDDEGD
jgi:hypothetical protein